jgi:uncharacterized membrane protein YphA (DoxX/SURF4 family)
MSFVVLVGRILFALVFIGSGINGHLMQADATAGYGASRGLKSSRLMVQISGVLIAAGGVGVALGIWADLAALGLAAYSLVAAFMIHHFWTDEGDAQVMEMTNFMKNLALAGAGLVIFAAIGVFGEALGFTITGPLFDLSL